MNICGLIEYNDLSYWKLEIGGLLWLSPLALDLYSQPSRPIMTSTPRQTRIPFGTSFTNLPSPKPSTPFAQNSLKQDQSQRPNHKNRKALSKAHETCSLSQSTSLHLHQEKVPRQQALIVLPTITEEKENRQNGHQNSIISNAGSSNFDPSLAPLFCGPPSDEMTIVPPSGLTEMEERCMIEAYDIPNSPEDDGDADDEDCDAIIGRGVLVPAAVFLPDPSANANRDASSIKLVKIIEEGEEVHSTEIPERSHPIVKSLSTRSREAQLARIYETRPVTTSLLSFTDDTPMAVKRRVHPKRMWQARYGPVESDALRKESCERRRLLQSGLRFLPAFPPLSNEPNLLLFPRAGSLHQLHSPESNGSLEDYALGYVDLSFIRKSLYAFDLRMRTGTDLWSDEEVDGDQTSTSFDTSASGDQTFLDNISINQAD
ncbi:15390_t:CDS:2, partial [Acaulospora colombiana]